MAKGFVMRWFKRHGGVPRSNYFDSGAFMHRVNCLAMRFMRVSVQSFLYGEVQYPLTERAIRSTAELKP